MNNWIWLNEKSYPENQQTRYSLFHEGAEENYSVAEFKKSYEFEKIIAKADLTFSADTRFQLYLNDNFLNAGPVSVGGDWLGNDKKRSDFYETNLTVHPNTKKLDFLAKVLMAPLQMCDYSMGHGGFMLKGEITFEDDTKSEITTDSTWLCRLLGSYVKPYVYDERISPTEFQNAVLIDDIWNCKSSPIPPMEENPLAPLNDEYITVDGLSRCKKTLEFNKIYGGYINISIEAKGEVKIGATIREAEEEGCFEEMIFCGDSKYRSFRLYSVGNIELDIENSSSEKVQVHTNLILSHYPIKDKGAVETSDDFLNKLTKTCGHSLKFCRHTLHLDSPLHCEPLACTGDYYIETLMTLFSYGDMDLAKFDIRRQAGLMCENDGRIFHTSFSLIWTYWLYDVYMITGDKKLLEDCKKALDLLFKRFETYMGDNGLVETPPDYMFVDWIFIDGHSLHHPPKALGQTCLNMFLYKALTTASKIYYELGEGTSAKKCIEKAEKLRNAVNTLLYDIEKGMYFEGLNTPTDESLYYVFMPANTDKRYYLKQSNILAAYTGICEKADACRLIDMIMEDKISGDVQPYFLHYLLEAVYINGMREKYTLSILERWRESIENSEKGLVEGFIKPPEGEYHFDHSHAWGGSPLYSLPKALLGFEITKPGMKEIQISPDLLGLEFANIKAPTPYGYIDFRLTKGNKPCVDAPNEICVISK